MSSSDASPLRAIGRGIGPNASSASVRRGFEPAAQEQRGAAVVGVVRLDLVELRLVVRLEPRLVGDDAAAGVHHLARRGRCMYCCSTFLSEYDSPPMRTPWRTTAYRSTKRSARSSTSISVSRVPCAPISRLSVVGS